MNILRWVKDLFTGRGKALSLYRRGMVRAKEHDHRGAIDDYTAVIELPGVPSDVKAMALFNRALVYMASGEDRDGAEDLDVVLAMDDAPVEVKTMARQKIAKRESRTRNTT